MLRRPLLLQRRRKLVLHFHLILSLVFVLFPHLQSFFGAGLVAARSRNHVGKVRGRLVLGAEEVVTRLDLEIRHQITLVSYFLCCLSHSLL